MRGIFTSCFVWGRAFKKYEKKLAATDQELVGILHAIESYRQFLSNGQPFVILTDHLSLCFIQNLKYASSPKLARYSLLLQHLQFQVVHIKGKSNVLPDFLSRYPIKSDDETEDPPTPTPNSLLDVDHFNYLSSIQVEQVVEDLELHNRRTDETRRRAFRVYELLPIEAQIAPQAQQSKGGKSSKKGQTQRKEQTTANTATGTDVDVDAQLMDTDMQQMYDGLRNQLIPVVNLQTQAHNDAFVAAMIEYLTTGQLPTDRDLAKRLLFQTEDFFHFE
jgi:hypothetical protein